ncbi:MAG: helix-turn-helix transcriptional regulator [Gammaproteobacteria bacterium]|nr:MAG: helix-turn-helix transcriptional regulator [Gammaproteobacteria bacterium]
MTTGRRRPRSAPSVSQYDTLVTRLYEAATDAQLWPQALEAMVRFVGNSGVHLSLTDENTGLVRQDVNFGMPEKLMFDYDPRRVAAGPRVENALAHPEYRLLYDDQRIDENRIDHSEYYHWLQQTGDGIRYYLGAQLFPTAGRPSWISFPFRKSEGHARREHLERLKLFVPHLERALRVSRQLGTASLLSSALQHSIDREQTALVIVGESGRVLLASSAAEDLARSSQWIRLSNTGVHLANPNLDRQLQAALRDCRQLNEGSPAPAGEELEALAPDGSRFQLSIAPLMFQGRMFGIDRPAAMLTITRLPATVAAARERLRRLTAAELFLAQAIARGATVAGFARGRGTSMHTVRAQLKSIFQKTGTHRQAELVALVRDRVRPPEPESR